MGPAPDECSREVLEAVLLVMRQIRGAKHEAGDLTMPQFRVLLRVRHRPGLSISDLAEDLGLSAATASTMVDSLVGRDLLSRASAADDRRRVEVRLTEAGAEVLAEHRRRAQWRLEARLERLSPAERGVVLEAMRLLDRAFRSATEECGGHA